MNEQIHNFLLLLGFGAFCGLVGAAFGATAGSLYWASGRASGTAAGLAVARALARARRSTPPRRRQGAIVGAVDGFLFLGLTALALAFVLRHFGQVGDHFLAVIALGGLVLAAAAVALGALAYGLTRAGVRGLAVSLPLAILSALAGLLLAGWSGSMVGVVGGLALGTLLLLLSRTSAREMASEPPPQDPSDDGTR